MNTEEATTYLIRKIHKYDQKKSTAELLIDFIDFMADFEHTKYAFDARKGKIVEKASLRPGCCLILNVYDDPNNDPRNHPYYIVDPFDVNHNPGKQVKYEKYKQKNRIGS